MATMVANTGLNEKRGMEVRIGGAAGTGGNGNYRPDTIIRDSARLCHDGDFSHNLTHKIEEASGQNLSLCYQCGLCAGGCPAGSERDLLPHQILHLAQLGLWDRIKNSRTAWLCAGALTSPG
jgi:heterodisulfide reductase subunit C